MPTAVVAPTVVAAAGGVEAPEPDEVAQPARVEARARGLWLQTAQFALGAAFILLAAVTIVVMLQRQRAQ